MPQRKKKAQTKEAKRTINIKLDVADFEGGYCTNRPYPRLSTREQAALRHLYEGMRGEAIGEKFVDNPSQVVKLILARVADELEIA